MTFNPLARKHFVKRKAAKAAKAGRIQKARELGELIQRAAKALKSRGLYTVPLDLKNPGRETTAAQIGAFIDLLVEYAKHLDAEYQDFIAQWPDKDGKRAAVSILQERARVLQSIASLKVSMAGMDYGPEK